MIKNIKIKSIEFKYFENGRQACMLNNLYVGWDNCADAMLHLKEKKIRLVVKPWGDKFLILGFYQKK